MLGGDDCRVDAYLVVGGTHHHFLTPVAKEVALIAGGAFRVVIGQRAGQSFNQTLFVFVDAAGSIFSVDIVETFVTATFSSQKKIPNSKNRIK